MKFSEIIGQKEMAERLRSLVDNNRLPHAIMLCGPEGSGKMALAFSLASYILCTGKQAGDADTCGECPSCKMLNKFQHPDLHFTFPIIKPKGASSDKKFDSDDYIQQWYEMLQTDGLYFGLPDWMKMMKATNQQSIIPVAESDRLIKKLSMKSNQGGKKVSIIWLPERMKDDCANKMLKLIEEPPSDTHFILVCINPDLLLETIRSRVQRFSISPIKTEEMITALQHRRGLSEDDAKRIARISKGNWLKAVETLTPGNDETLYYDLYVMLMRLAYQRKVSELKKWAEQAANLGRDRQIRMLQFFLRLTREFFMYNFHMSELNYMTIEEENFAKKFAPFVNEGNVIGMYELFQRTIRDIGQNANAKMQFFDLTMKMAVFIHRK